MADSSFDTTILGKLCSSILALSKNYEIHDGYKWYFWKLRHSLLSFCSISEVYRKKSPVWSASLFSCPFAGNTARMRSSFLHVFLQSYTILSLAIFLLHDESQGARKSTLGYRRLPFHTKVDHKFCFIKYSFLVKYLTKWYLSSRVI